VSISTASHIDPGALEAAAKSLRILAMDAVEASSTGHPGMPMGCADLAAVLYGEILRHDPADPKWVDRDRVVLSAGHGSALLYGILHLTGYDLPLDEVKRLRRIGSLTPGHPEYGLTPGVETTTGPLGAGFATAVGMAIAEQKLAHRFNAPDALIIDHYTYVISGDGCLMEGISHEAASLAGHLRLGKLIVFYDSNQVSIEGPTSITFTEDVGARFRAYGWQTLEGSAHDPSEILSLVEEAQAEQSRPTLIELHSVIGRGAPTQEGGHKIHGTKLGPDEIRAAKRAMGAPEDEAFYVFPEAREYFARRQVEWAAEHAAWARTFEEWRRSDPNRAAELEAWLDEGRTYYSGAALPAFSPGDALSTRDVSGQVLNAYAKAVPNLIGGSADLSTSNKTEMPGLGVYGPEEIDGRTIRYGVREHAMASITNGLQLHGGFRPFAATLFVFVDYMRPAMRLAALMGLPVIFILTHDSIYLGGDGPTHQAVEHLTSLRIIPNMHVLRPGDPEETVAAWQMAMERRDGPTCLVLSRQPLTVYEKSDGSWRESMRTGAYVVREPAAASEDPDAAPDVVIVGTGSEVGMALEAAELLAPRRVRVVSMVSRELFLAAPRDVQARVIPAGAAVYVAEAGSGTGWEALTGGRRDRLFCIDRFGASGRPQEVADYLGFTAAKLAERVEATL
jgi:transketolase